MNKNYLFYLLAFIANSLTAQTCSDPGNTIGDTGCVTFIYAGNPVTYTTVRATDGNFWLQQNLGSSAVATTQSDENSYGDLFQWGRWVDGHQIRNSETSAVPTTNNPAGYITGTHTFFTGSPAWWTPNTLTDKWEAETPDAVSDVNGCDPCKAIGNGWRLPTEAEWIAITESENIENPATAFQSTLKLPASGYRSASGALTFVGTRGYFWSTTASSTGAKYMYVGTTIANASAGGPRGQAAALRCFKTGTLGLPEVNKTNASLYPNPVKNTLSIQTDLVIRSVKIYNQTGHLVAENTTSELDLSTLSSGIYLVQIQFSNDTVSVQKIVKQ